MNTKTPYKLVDFGDGDCWLLRPENSHLLDEDGDCWLLRPENSHWLDPAKWARWLAKHDPSRFQVQVYLQQFEYIITSPQVTDMRAIAVAHTIVPILREYIEKPNASA